MVAVGYAIQAFADLLDTEYGVHVKVRWSSAKGRDVDGACGQLVVEQQPKRTDQRKSRV